MLSYVRNSIESFFEDIRYNGKRAVAYLTGKKMVEEGTKAGSPMLADMLTGSALTGAGKYIGFIVIPAASAFSAVLTQVDYIHRRNQLTEDFKPELAAKLGKKEAEVTASDLDKVAEVNPTLNEATRVSRWERNIGVVISALSTALVMTAMMLLDVKNGGPALLSDGQGFLGMNGGSLFSASGLTELAVKGTVALGGYFAVKTPMHYIADQIGGVKEKTVADHILDLRHEVRHGRGLSQERVLGVLLEAHPTLDEAIAKDYGKPFIALPAKAKRAVIREMGPALQLEQLTEDINLGRVRPEEIAFKAYGQESGVARKELAGPVPVAESVIGNVLHKVKDKLGGLVHATTQPETAQAQPVTVPMPVENAPRYVSADFETPDHQGAISVRAMRDDTRKGEHRSFVSLVGRHATAQGMTHVERVERSFSSVEQTV